MEMRHKYQDWEAKWRVSQMAFNNWGDNRHNSIKEVTQSLCCSSFPHGKQVCSTSFLIKKNIYIFFLQSIRFSSLRVMMRTLNFLQFPPCFQLKALTPVQEEKIQLHAADSCNDLCTLKKRWLDVFISKWSILQHYLGGVYLLLIGQVQRLQFGALVGCVDLQQVVKVSGEHQRTALHQLQHWAQQMLPSILHLALQIIKHLIQTVLEEGGAHIACSLKQQTKKNTRMTSFRVQWYF